MAFAGKSNKKLNLLEVIMKKTIKILIFLSLLNHSAIQPTNTKNNLLETNQKPFITNFSDVKSIAKMNVMWNEYYESHLPKAKSIYQIFLQLGRKKLEQTVSLPPIKEDFIYDSRLFTDNGRKIYVVEKYTKSLPYGYKKFAIFHEIIHTKQWDAKQNNYITIDPNHYPAGHEREADSEALHNLGCWKCALDAASCRLSENTSIISKIFFSKKDEWKKYFFDKGYISREAIIKGADELKQQEEKCGYHSYLDQNLIYRLRHIISPICAYTTYQLVKPSPNKQMNKKRCASIMFGALVGMGIERSIGKYIERKAEEKVELGEIEP